MPGVTPQDDEAAFGKVDVQSTGHVDKHELVVALREVGKAEREIQRLLDTVSVHKELVTPSPQPYNHNVDVPMVGPEVTVPKMRKAHVVPDVKGTGLVDKHEMPDAWREMGKQNERSSSFWSS